MGRNFSSFQHRRTPLGLCGVFHDERYLNMIDHVTIRFDLFSHPAIPRPRPILRPGNKFGLHSRPFTSARPGLRAFPFVPLGRCLGCCSEEPLDGIFGFSQGANMASLLAAQAVAGEGPKLRYWKWNHSRRLRLENLLK